MAEVQPKPAGVVDKVKGALRKMFTVEGRAEVMAQKQIDEILKQVPEDKRVEAMKMLEARRPDLVAGKMEDAKGSLVRDAAIGAAAVGVAATGLGVAYVKRDAIMDAAFSMGVRKPNISATEDNIYVKKLVDYRKAKFVESIRKATDPVKGFMDGMRKFVRVWPFNTLDLGEKVVATPPSIW